MNHFKFNKLPKAWGKGLLTSVLGTTISIILTFGTSALVESKQKADAQRQTAMMVIHDIDVCIDQMEEMAKDEEKRNNAMQYVLAHLDQPASLPEDTIALALEMLIDNNPANNIFDDAKENIFKSSQEIWSNLDNMAFIDNMENFYDQRREVSGNLEKNPIFVHPITYDDYVEMTRNSESYRLDEVAVLKEKLKDPRIKFYVDLSVVRTRAYRRFAQKWKDISDRNKFIMNISDEELAEYIKNSQRSGRPVSQRDLTGQWEREVNGNEHYYYHFLEEDSFCIEDVTLWPNPVYNNDIIVTYIYGGKWSLKNDTLFMICAPRSAEVKLDTSRITYRPEMRDSVRSIIRKVDIAAWKESLRKSLERDRRDTFPVTTNQARDKIEMIESRDKDGNVNSRYLKRVKEK